MFTSIVGRSVLVTGGTKGIGKGIARVFARAGANVVVSGRDTSSGEAVLRDLSGLSGSVSFVRGDVGLATDCERIAAETVARNGGLDVLCANAGVYPSARIEEMTEADVDAIFATNVKGPS
jgi:3-oxoacyl-[acyl-carrier protein] reductase